MNRILFAYPEVSQLFPNGGIGTFVSEAAAILAASGCWQVDILTDTTYAPYITQGDLSNAQAALRQAGVRLMDLDREDGIPCAWASPDVSRAERYHRQRILKNVPGWEMTKAKGREELAQWLATDVDICVVPSRGDNYPNVVMEAARAGCPK